MGSVPGRFRSLCGSLCAKSGGINLFILYPPFTGLPLGLQSRACDPPRPAVQNGGMWSPPSLGTLMAVCRQPDAAASLPLSGFSRIHATRRIPWQSSLEESLVSKPGGIVGDLAFPLDKMGNFVGFRAIYPPLGPIVSCDLKLHEWSLHERLRLWLPTAACRSLSSPSPPLALLLS